MDLELIKSTKGSRKIYSLHFYTKTIRRWLYCSQLIEKCTGSRLSQYAILTFISRAPFLDIPDL